MRIRAWDRNPRGHSRAVHNAGAVVAAALIALAAAAALSTHGLAASLSWQGGDDELGLWSDANNWNPAQVPVSGDILVFGSGATSRLTQDDIAGLSVAGMSFTDNYQLNGSALTVTGPITFGGSAGQCVISDNLVLGAGITVSNADTSSTVLLSGDISMSGGARTLAIHGAGRVDLGGNVTTTSVATGGTPADGYVLMDGAASTAAVAVGLGGTLGGRGSTGPAVVGSASPGTAATLSPGSSPGHLTVGALVFLANSHYAEEINGTAAGSQYDQTTSNGAVAIDPTASLDVVLGFTPAVGNAFTIIDKSGAGAVSGNFAGLPEGSEFVVGASTFRISYRGGDGNDVVLSTLASFTSSTTLASSLNPSAPRQAVTFTARVSAAGGSPAPTGSVRFSDGSTVLGTVALSGLQDAALTVATLAAGTHAITATYEGDAHHGASAATLTQRVNGTPVPSAGAGVPWQGELAVLVGLALCGIALAMRRRPGTA